MLAVIVKYWNFIYSGKVQWSILCNCIRILGYFNIDSNRLKIQRRVIPLPQPLSPLCGSTIFNKQATKLTTNYLKHLPIQKCYESLLNLYWICFRIFFLSNFRKRRSRQKQFCISEKNFKKKKDDFKRIKIRWKISFWPSWTTHL